jgi:hypothetical protein
MATDALHTVAETGPHLDDCKAEGVSDDQRAAIADALAHDPRAGVLLKEGGGSRKVRVAGRGFGKRGDIA